METFVHGKKGEDKWERDLIGVLTTGELFPVAYLEEHILRFMNARIAAPATVISAVMTGVLIALPKAKER